MSDVEPGSPDKPFSSALNPAEAQRKLHELLESMWELRKSTVQGWTKILDETVPDLLNRPTIKSRAAAIDAAHKLAGILGTFGLPVGTELAREIETVLELDQALNQDQVDHLKLLTQRLSDMVAQRSLPTSR